MYLPLWTVAFAGKYTGRSLCEVFTTEDKAIDYVLGLDMGLFERISVERNAVVFDDTQAF